MNCRLRLGSHSLTRWHHNINFCRTFHSFRQTHVYSKLLSNSAGSHSVRDVIVTSFLGKYAILPRNTILTVCRNYAAKAAETGTAKINSQARDISKIAGYKRLLELAKPERWKIAGAVGLLLLSSAVTMSVPYGAGKVIDMVNEELKTSSENDKKVIHSHIQKYVGILMVVFLIGAVCNSGRVYLMSVTGQRIARALRQKVYGAMLKQESGFFDRYKTGELVSRLSSDSLIVSNTMTTNVSDGLRSTIAVVAGLCMMFYTSVELSCATLIGVVPPIAILYFLSGRFIRTITKKVQDSLAEASQVAEERFSNIRVVKTFGHESYERALFSQKLEEMLLLAYKEARWNSFFFGMTGLLGNVMIVSAIFYGGPMINDSTFTIGQLSSFLMYAGYTSLNSGAITRAWGDFNRGLGAGARLWELIDRKPAILSTGGISPLNLPVGHLEFRNVSFAYPTRPNIKVLENMNLVIPSGAMTAVVGGSGSGKSTLAALILRFYDPSAGQVYFDGEDVSRLNWMWLRKHIALVSQEPVLFSCSIRDNIAYGAVFDHPSSDDKMDRLLPHVDDDRIWEAAKVANAEKFIRDLPDGLNTLVGERGITLSGGQRQRVAIARALMRDPKVLLLDEATSALDAESEHLVQEALERILKGRTVLTIAHRLSTIRNADQIAVLDKGHVVELGSYSKLINQQDSAFRKLVKLQTFQDPLIRDNI